MTRLRALALVFLLAQCTPTQYRIDCQDLVPPEQATFTAVTALVVKSNPKSCDSCHNVKTPIDGYEFDGPAVAYDALANRMEWIYPQLVSGRMPPSDPSTERWSADDLRLLRSWYCYGAFYDQ